MKVSDAEPMGGTEGPVGTLLRAATNGDSDWIVNLARSELGREPEAVGEYLAMFPSCAAIKGSEGVGFAFCGPFAPDILEIRNMLVRADLRHSGLGAAILDLIEQSLPTGINTAIVVNSDLYPGTAKRSATSFYRRHGYALIHDTGSTRVLAKRLG